MSMVMYLRRASEADIARIEEDSAAAVRFAFEEGDQSQDLVDFDVAWDAVHFMLCSDTRDSDHPLGIIACVLPEVGLDANGLGAFSVISPAAMKRFAEALDAISDDELARRYDPPAWFAADLYRRDMFVEDGVENSPETRAYVMQSIPALQRLASSCAANGEGAIRLLR